MMYFGLPLEHDEAMRLLNHDNSILTFSAIDVYLYDKNVFILGFEMTELFSIREGSFKNLAEAMKHLAEAKILWDKEIRYYKINLSTVRLAQLEDEPRKVHNPEPFLMC
jgi:hypothetical protein